jgi:hypothetical protein
VSTHPNVQAQRHQDPHFLKAEPFTRDPDDVAQCQRWMSMLGGEVAEIDRKLTEMRNPAFRVMLPSGRFASRPELGTMRTDLIEVKNAIHARVRELRQWRNERVKAAERGDLYDPNVKPKDHPTIIDAKAIKTALHRYGLLDDFFDRFSYWFELDEMSDRQGVPEASITEAWTKVEDAYDRVTEFDDKRAGRTAPEGDHDPR